MIRTIVADKTAVIFAVQAVTAALFARERTGDRYALPRRRARNYSPWAA